MADQVFGQGDFSPENFAAGVVHPQDITGLHYEEHVTFIVRWFRAFYEDPQSEMPYAEKDDPGDSAYRYPWGGPYDAYDEISRHFTGLASDATMQAAVREIEKNGFEWAPSPNHPDQLAAAQEAERGKVHSPEDGEDVTPTDLRDLPLEEQAEFMARWFRALFEDPAELTPHDSSDGGYLYIWGGPYDARDQIGNTFAELASEEAIEAAIKEVQSDGLFEWAPSSRHPDRRSHEARPSLENIRARIAEGVRPQLGDPYELETRQHLQRQIDELRAALEEQAPRHGGMGHNQPPEEMTLEPETVNELIDSTRTMADELATPTPDVSTLAERTGRLERVIAWAAAKLDLTVDAFMKRLGDLAAVGVAGGVVALATGRWQVVWIKLAEVVKSALSWLDTVTLPF